MATRVKLCAIAKNEGAYLADWVFHHLHFGFDGIEVWVNDTEDPSLRILKRIRERYPQVRGRRADRMLRECLATGRVFQRRAYARLAKRAREEGYTHVALFDLDEYWTPRDFRTDIKSFLPDDPEVKVISFPWGLDVPDPTREPFVPLLPHQVQVQLDPHVKSVMRLDGSIHRYAVHTGATRHGRRLWVRDDFPMVDRAHQVGWSLVTEEFLAGRWHDLPEAFILHAINRSQREYVGSLSKGLRQAGVTDEVKINRFGFMPAATPVLTLSPGVRAKVSYRARRRKFLKAVGTDRMTRRSRHLMAARADTLVAQVVADPEALARLRLALRGLSLPELDEAHPGWDQRILWHVEAVETSDAGTAVVGWAFSTPVVEPLEFGLRDADGREWTAVEVTTTQRPEVRDLVVTAPLECGFEMLVPPGLRAGLHRSQFLVRTAGSTTWDVTPMNRVAPRTSSTTG